MDDGRELRMVATELAVDYAFERACSCDRGGNDGWGWLAYDLLLAADAVCALLVGETPPPAPPRPCFDLDDW
jgi:hypothetical protein